MAQRIADLDIVDVAEKLGLVLDEATLHTPNVLCRCVNPGHADTHASMSLNREKGVWYCQVCAEGGGVMDLVRVRHQCERAEALDWLEKRCGLERKRGGPPAKRAAEAVEEKSDLERFHWRTHQRALRQRAELSDYWKQRKISDEALLDFGIGVVEYKGSFCFVMPMYGADSRIVGRRLRLVNPSQPGRWWPRKGTSPAKEITWKDDKVGLFVPSGFRQDKPVWIFEGWPDVLSARSLGSASLNCIGTPGTGVRVSSPMAKALMACVSTGTPVTLAVQNDEAKQGGEKPSHIWAAKLIRIFGKHRVDVWLCPQNVDDVNDALVKGLEFPACGVRVSAEGFLRQEGIASAPVLVPLGKSQMIQAEEGRGLMIRTGNDLKLVANYDIRATDAVSRYEPGSFEPVSDIAIEIMPLVGEDLKPKKATLTQEAWLRSDLLLVAIHNAYPLAWEADDNTIFWKALRARAVMGLKSTRVVHERCGWMGDRISMPSLSITAAGVSEESTVELPRQIRHDWNVPPVNPARLVERLVDLTQIAPEEHLNAALLGIHIVAATSGLVMAHGKPVSRPWILVEGPTEIGKSFLARAHGLVHFPTTVMQGGGGVFNLQGASAKWIEKALSHLDSTVALIDDWNPNARVGTAEAEFTRLFHAMFDQAGNARLTRTRQMTNAAPTGAVLVMTAEDVPRDPATANRFLTVHMTRRPETLELLNRLQQDEMLLRSLMPFLLVGALRLYGSFAKIADRLAHLKNDCASRVRGTGRHSGHASALLAGLAMTREILMQQHQIDYPEIPHWAELGSRMIALEEALEKDVDRASQNGAVAHEDRPDVRFLSIVRTLIDSDLIHAPFINDAKDKPCLAWYSEGEELVYLVVPAIFETVKQFAQRSGMPMRWSDGAIKSHLEASGALVLNEKGGRRHKRRRPGSVGIQCWTIAVKAEALQVDVSLVQEEMLPYDD